MRSRATTGVRPAVHQIWLGGEPPAHLADFMRSWSELEGWDYKLWTDADFGWLKNQRIFDEAAEIVGPKEVGQLRADVARLEILYTHGGVYVDCDMELKRDITPLLDVECFAGYEDYRRRWVNNAVLGSIPHHPFIAELIYKLPDAVQSAQRRGVRRPNIISGPQFVTPIWRANWTRRVTVYPAAYFYPYSWSELERADEDFPDAYCIHHWHHRRTTRGHRK